MKNKKLSCLVTTSMVVLMVVLLSSCDTPVLSQETGTSTSGNPNSEIVIDNSDATGDNSEVITESSNVASDNSEVASDKGFLVVVYSGAKNEAPISQATVIVLKNDVVVHTGPTVGGTFRAVLPEGTYDVMILTSSRPPGGLIRRGVTVSKDSNVVLTARTPSEGALTVQLQSPAGYPLQQDYTLIITAGEEEVHRVVVRTTVGGRSVINVRTDLIYDLHIQYGDIELREEDIQVRKEGTEVDLMLPYNEGTLNLEIQAGDQSLDGEANIILLDSSGKILATTTTTQGVYSTVLPADLEYSIRVQYLNQVQEESFHIIAGVDNMLVFEFGTP